MKTEKFDGKVFLVLAILFIWLLGGLITIGSLIFGGSAKVNMGGSRGYINQDY